MFQNLFLILTLTSIVFLAMLATRKTAFNCIGCPCASYTIIDDTIRIVSDYTYDGKSRVTEYTCGMTGATGGSLGQTYGYMYDDTNGTLSSMTVSASGAIAASPLGIVGQRIAGGIIGGLSYVADCYFHDKAMKLDEAIVSAGMGVMSGQIGGPGANEHMALTNAIKSTKTVMAREARRANRQYAQKAIMSAIRHRNNTISASSWSSSFLFSTGTGISNAVTGAYSELDWLPNFLSYKPW